MKTRDDGGPAFPVVGAPGAKEDYPGLTLRDYLAATALPAVIAAYTEANGRCIGTEHAPINCAAHAYRFADAMLAERAK